MEIPEHSPSEKKNISPMDTGVIEIIIDSETLATIESRHRVPDTDAYQITRLEPNNQYRTTTYLPKRSAEGWTLVKQ